MWEYSQTDLMYLIEEMYVSLGFVEGLPNLVLANGEVAKGALSCMPS